ncbi:lipopolysaccharide biosynthesis protein [Nocardioides sp. zg-1228]|uniref:lipopolysaccharide biosynthesis protein n=1 Tax=Nocardioides sp. zg-1228 TaxID=2763008 RepID=UPI001642ECEC|nr:oligosaccharide flippase family protein [Nocardioides sp. zg-1228]MBC2934426.1 oligosaccharide flippase family protein [Nocardioides sp. zg-1228]QSF59191.1 oligosaccharide flippase family protein [Nocardioides sp. zg-1228]
MPTRARDRSDAVAGPRGRLERLLGGSGQIAVAMLLMNLATYGFTMTAARIIGPVPYGAFFALMNLVMIISVVMLGLQATAARRISSDPAHVGQIEREILRVSLRASLLLGAVLLMGAPLLNTLLDLDSLPTAVLAAFAAVPMTMTGAQAGILQGERRWRELAVLYVLSGVPRLLVGVVLILWQPTEFMAFLGVTIGFYAPFLYGLAVLRHGRVSGETHERHGFGPIIKEAVVNSQALFAYFALTNVDMLVGRSVLDSHDSGLYAAGLIVSRAVMFLPQFVVVVAFPSMSTSRNRSRALAGSLLLVGGLGGACVLATAVLPDLVLVFAGGGDYEEVRSLLWVFALLGTCMAVLQLLVYSVLARQGTMSMVLIWVAFGVVVAVASTLVSTVGELLALVLSVDVMLLVVLLAISAVTLRGRSPAQ